MNDNNKLTFMEYYDIYTVLQEYCKLKEDRIKTSDEPFYVKDVMEANVGKIKKIVTKMYRRMDEYQIFDCCY